MVIAADELFRLICKTDLDKYKIEWYRKKLGVSDENGDNTAANTSTKPRMISRGPFIATFKNESITFVTSLDAAARPLRGKRKRRKKKSSQGSISGELSTLKLSVKTEPVGRKDSSGVGLEGGMNHENGGIESKSPKRKKIEDKTGMIIVAEIDHDEISAVSVSPTNTSDGSDTSPKQKDAQPLSLISGNFPLASSSKSSGKDRSRSSRKSSRKKKTRRSSLRSVKSIGSASTKSDDGSSCSGSVLSSETLSTSTTVSSRLEDRDPGTHERSPSNESAVDLREVLEEHAHGNPFSFMPTHMKDPYHYHCDMQGHAVHIGMPNHSHQMPLPHMMYAYPPPHSHFNGVQWQHSYPYPYRYNTRSEDIIEYEECFLFKGVTSFIKKMFGLDKKQELFEPSPQKNQESHYPQMHGPQQYQYTNFAPAPHQPRRSRSVSRVFDENDKYYEHIESASTDSSSEALDIKKPDLQREESLGRTLSFQLDQQQQTRSESKEKPIQRTQSSDTMIEESMSDWKAGGPRIEDPGLPKIEKSMSDWKAGGPRTKEPNLPITHDFRLDNNDDQKQRTQSRNMKLDRSTKSNQRKHRSRHEKGASSTPVFERSSEQKKKNKNVLKERSQSRSRSRSHGRKVLSSDVMKSHVLSKQRPQSLSSASRSKTESLGLLKKKSVIKPSLVKSSSVGSSLSQSRTRSNVGAFHYR